VLLLLKSYGIKPSSPPNAVTIPLRAGCVLIALSISFGPMAFTTGIIASKALPPNFLIFYQIDGKSSSAINSLISLCSSGGMTDTIECISANPAGILSGLSLLASYYIIALLVFFVYYSLYSYVSPSIYEAGTPRNGFMILSRESTPCNTLECRGSLFST
jgi:hypothetical protein